MKVWLVMCGCLLDLYSIDTLLYAAALGRLMLMAPGAHLKVNHALCLNGWVGQQGVLHQGAAVVGPVRRCAKS
jgi:hypothetical protein